MKQKKSKENRNMGAKQQIKEKVGTYLEIAEGSINLHANPLPLCAINTTFA